MSLLISSTFGRLSLLPDHSGLGGHIPGGELVFPHYFTKHFTYVLSPRAHRSVASLCCPGSYFVLQCLIARPLCRESRKMYIIVNCFLMLGELTRRGQTSCEQPRAPFPALPIQHHGCPRLRPRSPSAPASRPKQPASPAGR